jgi:hypothetical protein
MLSATQRKTRSRRSGDRSLTWATIALATSKSSGCTCEVIAFPFPQLSLDNRLYHSTTAFKRVRRVGRVPPHAPNRRRSLRRSGD